LAPAPSTTLGDNVVDVAFGFNSNSIILKNTDNSSQSYTYYPFNSNNATVLFLDWNGAGIFAVSDN
jgi:hypothetical protein